MKLIIPVARGAVSLAWFVVTLPFRRALTRWKRRLRIGGYGPYPDPAHRCRLCLGWSRRAPEPDGGCFECPRRSQR